MRESAGSWEGNEQSIIRGVTEGDEESFQIFYRGTKGHVYRMVMLLANKKEDAGDIMSEVYMALLKALPSYQSGKPFMPWLNGVIARQCSQANRVGWRLGRLFKRAEQLGDMQQASEDAEQAFFKEELRREVRDMLKLLPYKHREVMILKYYGGHTFDEIGGILGIPAGTAKSRHHKALDKLRSMTAAKVSMDDKEALSHGY